MKLETYKTPRDKLVCIMNACKILGGMISEYFCAKKGTQVSTGADELIPLTILLVYDSNLRFPATEAYFIRRIRNEYLLNGAGEYYLTTYEAALDYLIKLGAETSVKDVSRAEEAEFEKQIAEIQSLDVSMTQSSPYQGGARLQTPSPQSTLSKSPYGYTPASYLNSTQAKFGDYATQMTNSHIQSSNSQFAPGSRAAPPKSLHNAHQNSHSELISANFEALASKSKGLLYKDHEKYLQHKDKNMAALFVSDLDRYHYEYQLLLKNYRQLSEVVTNCLKQGNS